MHYCFKMHFFLSFYKLKFSLNIFTNAEFLFCLLLFVFSIFEMNQNVGEESNHIKSVNKNCYLIFLELIL